MFDMFRLSSSTEGPTSAMKTLGMMKTMSGMTRRAGRRIAFSSMRSIRSVRISAASVRIAWASGVP